MDLPSDVDDDDAGGSAAVGKVTWLRGASLPPSLVRAKLD